MTSDPPPTGRRRAMQARDPRQTTLEGGQLIIGNELLSCFVLNISATGARISFREPVLLPETMTLKLADGSICPARRIWMRGTEVGLQFTSLPEAAASSAFR